MIVFKVWITKQIFACDLLALPGTQYIFIAFDPTHPAKKNEKRKPQKDKENRTDQSQLHSPYQMYPVEKH